MNIDGRCSSRDFASVPVRGGVFYLRNQSRRVEPLVSLSSALNGVRVLLEAYEGYERARYLETDLAVREEVRRRTVMLQDHLTRFEDRAREDGHREAASEAKRSKATLIAISEDVQFAISGGPSSSHGNIGRLPRGARKKLVNHDLRSLKMLVTATQAANDLLDAQTSPEGDAEALKRACAGVHDKIGRARNHLRERNMFIDGLMKR